MLESTLRDKLSGWLRIQPSTWHFKVHGTVMQRRGVPDFIGCSRGIMLGIELKQKRGQLSALQALSLDRIAKAGGLAAVVFDEHGLTEFKECLSWITSPLAQIQRVERLAFAASSPCGTTSVMWFPSSRVSPKTLSSNWSMNLERPPWKSSRYKAEMASG